MRCRITLTLLPGQQEYHDKITKVELLQYINDFLRKGLIVEKTDVTFQCSYLGDTFDNSFEKLGTKFKQNVGDAEFTYSIDGFAQVTERDAGFAHNNVLEMLRNYNGNFIGIGGESLLYGIAGKFKKVAVYTNSPGVHKDNLDNGGDSTLVDYEKFELEVKEPTTCVANVSRKGLRSALCKQLNQLYVKNIIAVYCADVYKRDLADLVNYYKADVRSNGNLYVVLFKRIPLIPLGNNCSIAYQLQKLNLRVTRYPFDWMRYKKVDQLIACLENKFQGFVNIVSTKKPSGQFYLLTGTDYKEGEISKEILVNEHGMEFPHDTREDMIRYGPRIIRMLSVPLADYVIDCKITPEQIDKISKLLPNLRKLIVVENVAPLEHTPDTWKKEHLNWMKMFSY